MSELRKEFGRQLRRLRRQADLTQEQLAEKAGLSVDFISNVERGINAPSFENLEKLAQTLNIEVRELFSFNQRQEANPDSEKTRPD